MIDILALVVFLSRAAMEGPQQALRALDAASRRPVEAQLEPPERAADEPTAPNEGARAPVIRGGQARGPVQAPDAPASPRPSGSGPGGPAPTTTAGGQIGAGGSTSLASGFTAGGTMAQPPSAGGPAGPGPDRLILFFVKFFKNKTQSGYREDVMVYAPDQSQPRPLLVVFHKWGVSHLDAWVNTTYFQEAQKRGWHVLAPLSASGVHLNSLAGQKNTEYAIDWALANFNIDRDRIYGVGFSMGGAAVANFAARHLDPGRFMFAAIVDHTGGVSHVDTYANSGPNAQYPFDFWFGDPFAIPYEPADPWEMTRSSVIDFDPQTLVVDTDTDLARNLTHVAVKVHRITNEPAPTAYLETQTDVFVSHLLSRGGTPILDIVPYAAHTWDSLDERSALSFLDPWTLRVPTNANTLADTDGKYFFFHVHQDAPNAFTPFSWSLNGPQNKVLIWRTRNLGQIDFDLPASGLKTDQTLRVVLDTNDGLADHVLIQGWPSNPADVLRDGVSQVGAGTTIYDAQKLELLILEWDGGQHVWDVVP